MAYDSAHGQFVLFDVNGVTWTGDGSTWTPQSPAVSPPPRQLATMAFDGKAVMLFGGQAPVPNADGTAGNVLDDTWTWDGVTWTRQSPSAHPLARYGASMASARDGATPSVVLFGGIVPGTQLCTALNAADGAATNPVTGIPIDGLVHGCYSDPSTWVWTQTPTPSWTQYPAVTDNTSVVAPQPRYDAAMAYDAIDRTALLFGGFRLFADDPFDAPLNDTWSWDSTKHVWVGRAVQLTQPLPDAITSALPPPLNPPAPPARGLAGMASDPQGVILFGGSAYLGGETMLGDTWLWNGKTGAWMMEQPTSAPLGRERPLMAMGNAGALLFGGIGCDPTPCPSRMAAMTDASWIWDGSTWSQRPSPPPIARDLAAGAFDPGSGQVVLFGGRAPTGVDGGEPRSLDDTWTWGGSAWDRRTVTSPPARRAAAAADDAAQGNLVLFGGLGANGAPLADTWTWDGTTWTQRHPTPSPPAAFGGAMAYDGQGTVVLFESHAAADGSGRYLPETWTWNGVTNTWVQHTPVNSPSARQGAAMASYSAGKVVLFGGVGADGMPLGDTWTWDGTNWTPQVRTLAPSPRTRAAMTFDTAAGRPVLFGGAGCAAGAMLCTFGNATLGDDSERIDGSAALGDTWTWDGTTWTEETTTVGPEARAGALLVYDSARQHVVLFGGTTHPGDAADVPRDGSFQNDTWTLDITHPPLGAALNPAGLSFGGEPVGTPGVAQTVTLTNSGTQPLVIAPGGIVAAPADYRQTNNCPGTLAAGTGCTISVNFTPSVAGSRAGTLSVSDGAPGSPQTVSLSGTGMPRLSGDAAAIHLQGVTLLRGGTPIPLPDGGQGVCEAGPITTAAETTTAGTGLPLCVGALGAGTPPVLMADVAAETVTTDGGVSHARSTVTSLSLLPGMGPGGTGVLEAGGLDAQSSAACAGSISGHSSVATLSVAGTSVATQPVGNRIVFNPTGKNPTTLYGNPVWINPTGGRIPMAIVTLNYSRYDPQARTQVSSPLEVEFPPGGALSSVIVGRVFISYASSGAPGCR